ncbi:hypothetical protein D3C81_2223630 [compost metagenome]
MTQPFSITLPPSTITSSPIQTSFLITVSAYCGGGAFFNPPPRIDSMYVETVRISCWPLSMKLRREPPAT